MNESLVQPLITCSTLWGKIPLVINGYKPLKGDFLTTFATSISSVIVPCGCSGIGLCTLMRGSTVNFPATVARSLSL